MNLGMTHGQELFWVSIKIEIFQIDVWDTTKSNVELKNCDLNLTAALLLYILKIWCKSKWCQIIYYHCLPDKIQIYVLLV